LLNACSLLPKIDELTALISTQPADIVAVTEYWLHNDIENRLILLNGYNLFRKDRATGRGGGVCVYIKSDILCVRLLDLENNRFECLWLCLRPRRLPRPLSGIVICVAYHPTGLPVSDHDDLNEYLINTTDVIRNKYPDHGLVITGDFNDFETGTLMSSQNVKQVVDKPTRETAILDLIITNLHQLYQCPHILAPLGSSDHNIAHWHPSDVNTNEKNTQVKSTKQLVRRYPRSGMDAFGRWASTYDWFGELEPNPTTDSMALSFTNRLTETIHRIFPQKKVTRHRNDKPWITPTIKQLIARYAGNWGHPPPCPLVRG
jgi:hypothetical protein